MLKEVGFETKATVAVLADIFVEVFVVGPNIGHGGQTGRAQISRIAEAIVRLSLFSCSFALSFSAHSAGARMSLSRCSTVGSWVEEGDRRSGTEKGRACCHFRRRKLEQGCMRDTGGRLSC
jgi:hypothetical protein